MKKFGERKLVKNLKKNIQAMRGSYLLEKKFKFLKDYPTLYKNAATELMPYYTDYISTTSVPYMAASLEASALNYILCENLKPASVIDMGSGFSSFVFRHFAQKNDQKTKVFSADDNASWLGKTAEYLTKYKTRTDNMLTLEELKKIGDEKFDIIFHDMGDMQTRLATLDFSMSHIAENGLIILDDTHKSDYAEKAKTLMAKNGFQCLSLRKYTLDKLGRFSFCSFKQNKQF